MTVTYRTPKEPLKLVAQVVSRAQLKHRWLESSPESAYSTWNTREWLNSDFRTLSPSSRAMMRAFHTMVDSSTIHLTGLGAEIFTGFFAKRPGVFPNIVPGRGRLARTLTDIYFRPNVKSPSASNFRYAANSFTELIRRGDWNAVDESISLADVFYWEHRNAYWKGSTLSGFDTFLPSLFGFNCRALFETGVAVPIELKKRAGFKESLIAHFDEKMSLRDS